MDFLKEILGDELYAQVVEKINAHNGNEVNKDKPVKLANLGGGEYVGKAKHDAAIARLDSQGEELTKANALIAELQKAANGDETLQAKVTEYKDQAAQLQAKLNATLIDSGLHIALMEAGGIDIKYLTYLAKNGDKPLEIGEDGKIKRLDDIVSGLKTASPGQFKKSGGVKVEENPLPDGGKRDDEPKSLADALRMQYENK